MPMQHYLVSISFVVSPPAPSRPQVLKVTDQSVTVAWDENECNGGHNLDSFTIRYSVPSSFFFRSYAFISGVRQKNYTITGLNPSSSYEVSVQAVSVDGIRGSYSASVGLTTLPPGEYTSYYWRSRIHIYTLCSLLVQQHHQLRKM